MFSISQLNNNHFLILLVIVVSIFLLANVFDQNHELMYEGWYVTDMFFLIFPITAVLFGTALSVKYRISGYNGLAWLFFTLSFVCWFAGEFTYDYEVEYSLNDISTLTSDIFWIAGYPLFFIFAILYITSFKRSISKNNILTASLISFVIILPTLIISIADGDELDSFTLTIYLIYPVLNSIILVPSILAVKLFVGGKVNMLWSLVLFAVLVDLIADTGFLIFSIEESYYPGHPIDILFASAYAFYFFGAAYNLKIFQSTTSKLTQKFDSDDQKSTNL